MPTSGFDVAVVGGSFAGLTAALQLGRARRAVAVIDAGSPRNRMAPAAHGVPGWDGIPPSDILARFRSDATAYPTVSMVQGHVVGASRVDGFVHLTLASGEALKAERAILAHGVRDVLPDLPGAAETWGRRLLHCPYCHGFEVRDRPLAVLAVHPMSAHQAQLLRADWSDDVTLLTGAVDGVACDAIGDAQVTIDPRRIAALREVDDGIIVVFLDGTSANFAAAFTAPNVSLDGTPARMLGGAAGDGPLGPFVQVGAMGQTSVPGVFAAGDCARPAHSVTLALGDGAAAGVGCHQSRLFPQMIQPFEVAA